MPRLTGYLTMLWLAVAAGCQGGSAVPVGSTADAGPGSDSSVTPCPQGANPACGSCVAGQWQVQPDGKVCDDGQACTLGDKCLQGQCQGTAKDCDDGTPCTADSCDPKLGCQWLPVAATCTDSNPCTVEEHCDQGECKSKPKFCGDDNPCTDEGCNTKTGECFWHSNGQEHCVPAFAGVTLPWALEIQGPPDQATLAGKVASSSGKIGSIAVNGKAVPVSSAGEFSTVLPLVWGSNAAEVTATDSADGFNALVRTVRYSTAWSPMGPQGLAVAQALAKPEPAAAWSQAWANLTLPRLWDKTSVPVAVQFGWDVPMGASVTATATPALEALQPDLGIPLRTACPGATAAATGGGDTLWLSYDLLNAVLWGAWRAGAWHGDLAPLLDSPTFAPFQAKGQASPLLPPLVQDCPNPAPQVFVDAYRLDLQGTDPKASPGAPPVTGHIWLGWQAPLTATCQGGVLKIGTGAPAKVRVEIQTTSADTDLIGILRKLLVGMMVPQLSARWSQLGLLTLPLPAGWTGSGVQCQLVAGGVVVSKGL